MGWVAVSWCGPALDWYDLALDWYGPALDGTGLAQAEGEGVVELDGLDRRSQVGVRQAGLGRRGFTVVVCVGMVVFGTGEPCQCVNPG